MFHLNFSLPETSEVLFRRGADIRHCPRTFLAAIERGRSSLHKSPLSSLMSFRASANPNAPTWAVRPLLSRASAIYPSALSLLPPAERAALRLRLTPLGLAPWFSSYPFPAIAVTKGGAGGKAGSAARVEKLAQAAADIEQAAVDTALARRNAIQEYLTQTRKANPFRTTQIAEVSKECPADIRINSPAFLKDIKAAKSKLRAIPTTANTSNRNSQDFTASIIPLPSYKPAAIAHNRGRFKTDLWFARRDRAIQTLRCNPADLRLNLKSFTTAISKGGKSLKSVNGSVLDRLKRVFSSKEKEAPPPKTTATAAAAAAAAAVSEQRVHLPWPIAASRSNFCYRMRHSHGHGDKDKGKSKQEKQPEKQNIERGLGALQLGANTNNSGGSGGDKSKSNKKHVTR